MIDTLNQRDTLPETTRKKVVELRVEGINKSLTDLYQPCQRKLFHPSTFLMSGYSGNNIFVLEPFHSQTGFTHDI